MLAVNQKSFMLRYAIRSAVIILSISAMALLPEVAFGQGCTCQRQGASVFGGLSTYMNPGDKQLVISYRGFISDQVFIGNKRRPGGPRNEQNQINFDFTYAVTPRWNLSVSLPLYINSYGFKTTSPVTHQLTSVNSNTVGIGDIGFRARYWVMSTENTGHNVGVTMGFKAPTGKVEREATVFGRKVPVDVSQQTGDGGWGITPGVQGFQRIKRVTLYGAANYLINPRNTTGGRAFGAVLANPTSTFENSAADQYSTQVGASVTLKKKWPVPSVAYRWEGQPSSDFIGKSHGFRRPGSFGFVEPSVSMAIGQQLLSLGVAIRAKVNYKQAPDAPSVSAGTVPKYMVFAAYSLTW